MSERINSDERANLNSPQLGHSRSERKSRQRLKSMRGEKEDRIDKNESKSLLPYSTATLPSADTSWARCCCMADCTDCLFVITLSIGVLLVVAYVIIFILAIRNS